MSHCTPLVSLHPPTATLQHSNTPTHQRAIQPILLLPPHSYLPDHCSIKLCSDSQCGDQNLICLPVNMDAALKARKLGSATARKNRMQERQFQQQQAHQERQDRKRQIMYDSQHSDDSDNDSVFSASSNPDLEFSAETPSEYSLRTPEDSSPELELGSQDVRVKIGNSTHDELAELDVVKQGTKELDTFVTNSHSGPKMQATLTTVADWNYDRFSLLVDPTEANRGIEIEDEEDATSSSDDSSDDFSPIEIAVPVSYSLPKSRPAMVRIMTTQSRSQSLRINKSNASRPVGRRHVSEQLLSNLTHDAFKVGGPRAFEASNSSRETLGSVSYSASLASKDENSFSRSASQTSCSDHGSKSPKRKSSLPLLFGNSKTGHSRMSSIKKFIRSSTLGPPSGGQLHAGVPQRHPSSATLETHFEGQRSSMEQIRETVVDEVVRPKTARAPSPLLAAHVPALPSTAWPTRAESITRPPNTNSDLNKEKPGSKLRPRSGSIGQALKSLSTAPKRSDSSMPPVPTIQIPQPQQIDADSFPTPPPLTPRNPRRTSHYSPFPPTPNKRTSSMAVGLGLRY